jgi:hypothetical protein
MLSTCFFVDDKVICWQLSSNDETNLSRMAAFKLALGSNIPTDLIPADRVDINK